MAKTPEFNKMIGQRMRDSDGFTYVSGKASGGKGNYDSAKRHKELIKRSKRTHKRSVKAQEMKRILKDNEKETIKP